jgi:hypothetical protein
MTSLDRDEEGTFERNDPPDTPNTYEAVILTWDWRIEG